MPTEEEKKILKLMRLQHDLKEIVMYEGSSHTYWGVLLDLEAVIHNKPSSVKKTLDEWVTYTEELLNKRVI